MDYWECLVSAEHLIVIVKLVDEDPLDPWGPPGPPVPSSDPRISDERLQLLIQQVQNLDV
ncbi:hypothetical protein L0F63_004484, partial [Massospora cicadina]